MTTSTWSYDAIAEVYATDMGQSMPFDDVGWYRVQCARHGGDVLELGCGTGRILLELRAAGISAVGVDRSLPMLARLQRDASSRGIAVATAQMDITSLALAGQFDVILAPYSLLTYVTDPADALALLRRLRGLLAPDGRVVVDAFVPQPVASFADFRLDYRRPHRDGTLERLKRITAHADGRNRIERRYRVSDAADRTIEQFETDETIRPYSPEVVASLAEHAGLAVDTIAWDYGTRDEPTGARFASFLLRAR